MALIFVPGAQFFDSNGRPCASGSLTFYDTGSTNPKAVYSDPDLSVEATNPYSLDSSGRIAVNIYGSGTYSVILKDSTGATVWSRDEVFGWSGGEPYYERTAAEIAAGVTPTAYQYEPGDVRRYGAVGDGVTDDTSAFQDAIDANKGGEVTIPAGLSVLCAGVILDGAAYDNTSIVVDGWIKLKPAPTRTTNNFNSTWTGLAFKDCDGCSLRGNFDGDRTNQQDREQTLCVGLAGVTNFSAPYLYFKEIRGDGVYISQSNYTAESAIPNGIFIGQIAGYNSADDGRNLLSIISGHNITVGSLAAYQIGGTVYGSSMPGGLDIEPNYAYQTVRNVTVGSVNYYGAASQGCAVHGRDDDPTTTQNVAIGSLVTIKTNAASLSDGLGNTTLGAGGYAKVRGATGVSFGSINGRALNSYMLIGVDIVNSHNVTINGGHIEHVANGVQIGRDAADTANAGCSNINVNLDVSDTCRYGWAVGKLTDATLKGRVISVTTGFYSGSLFGVFTVQHAIARVNFGVSVAYSADWNRAYRKDATFAPTFADCIIKDVNFESASWATFTALSDLGIPVINAAYYTDLRATAVPANGTHAVGQRIFNADPAAGEPLGWICTVAGSPGTWVPFGGIRSANAYTITNAVTDRAYDANATTLDEVADVLGTLIADLKTSGILQ